MNHFSYAQILSSQVWLEVISLCLFYISFNLLKDELTRGGIIDPMCNKILWLPTNCGPLKEIHLYIIDRHGRFAPLVDCNIDCTLVFIPHTK